MIEQLLSKSSITIINSGQHIKKQLSEGMENDQKQAETEGNHHFGNHIG